METMRKRVVVVGAGLAGLSTAVRLAGEGVDVTLVERRSILGGRTFSYRDKSTDDMVDNGQHAVTSAYRELRTYCRTIGTEDKMAFPKGAGGVFRDPKYGVVDFRGPKLPKPLKPFRQLAGFLRIPNVPPMDKLLFALSMTKLVKAIREMPADLDTMTATQWFDRIGMPKSIRRTFWHPLIIAALNEHPDVVSAHLLARLLRWSYLEQPGRMGYATVDLNSLFVDPAVAYLKKHNADILPDAMVSGIELDDSGRVACLRLKDGKTVTADAYIVAVHPSAFATLIKDSPLAADPFFARVAKIKESPITGVNLWFDQPLKMATHYEALLDTTTEWVFDRSRMHATRQGKGYFYTLITSASQMQIAQSNKKVIDQAVEEIHATYPESRNFKLLHASVIKEPVATFSGRPGFKDLRCTQKTPVENLFLAGDWTDTNLPSTMESAVKSGHLAAQETERFLGIERRN